LFNAAGLRCRIENSKSPTAARFVTREQEHEIKAFGAWLSFSCSHDRWFCLGRSPIHPVASSTQVVTTPVGTVAPGPVQVPIITWEVISPTLYANGNSKITAKNGIFGKLGLNLSLTREDGLAKQVEAYLSGQIAVSFEGRSA